MSYSGSRYDPADLVPPPGALPPVMPQSWQRAAREAGLQTAEPHTPDAGYRKESPSAEPDYFESPVEEAESRKSRRRQGKKSGKNGGAHSSNAAAERGSNARLKKASKWRLRAVMGNVTITDDTATVWFTQAPGTWSMRPLSDQSRFIRDEALVLSELRAKGVTGIHRRTLREPWPVTEWGRAHAGLAEGRLPDVPGALPWDEYLVGQQVALLDSSSTRKRRYWGIELPRRSMTAQAIVAVADNCSGLPGIGPKLTKWSEQVLLAEQNAAADHIEEIERVMLSPGVEALPADSAAIDYLLRRSAAVGMPLTESSAGQAPSGWGLPDLQALSNLTDMTYTPGDGHTVVEGTVGGRTYRSYVTVVTVGRMAALPIPEQKLPWQLLGDQLGYALEWSERLTLHTREETLNSIRKQRNAIESQYRHYTVEHDETPPDALAAQHGLSRRLETEMSNGGALATRASGWWRIAVTGSSPQQTRDRVSNLVQKYGPDIELEVEDGQYHLLKEFMPGEKLANTAHKRQMSVLAASAGMGAAADRIGDEEGIILGETASISVRPVAWNLFAAHDFFDKGGLTPLVGVQGAGKTHLAGMITYQALRLGVHAVILDPSGPLRKLAELPELKPFTRVYELTGRGAKPGVLNVYRVVAEPNRDDEIYDPQQPEYSNSSDPVAAAAAAYADDLAAAHAERVQLASWVLISMLDSDDSSDRDAKSAVRMAAAAVGGAPTNHLRKVIDAIDAIAAGKVYGAEEHGFEKAAPENTTIVSEGVRSAAGRIGPMLRSMSRLRDARVLFASETAGDDDAAELFDSIVDERLTILTMPGLQIDDKASGSHATDSQRLAGPLIHLAAWLATRLIYDKPRSLAKLLFLDENKYLKQSGAGRTLYVRLGRDTRKFRTRALVCSQLPGDFLGLSDGGDDQDQSQLTDEIIIGRLGSNEGAISDALKLLGLEEGEGYESILANQLGGGREDTYDKRVNEARKQRAAKTGADEARTYVVRLGGDIELVRANWTNFVHIAHVAQALNSRATAA
ncbi:ATP-binding protein [Rhodococcus sp. 1139]|uniref:ATP-binding protein n=1 Tax=Rhodococcus sp. 1139 TaxID=1833762 RepID=UPI00087229F4|nr:ATP-binding protein [Rhodococcus sp. 1139]OFE10074.1 hypothetical protein A5N83_04405 [Rhodococcus sp. 1139]